MQIAEGNLGTRTVQIAWNIFNYRENIYWRIKHDTTWFGWYRTGTSGFNYNTTWKESSTSSTGQVYYYEGSTTASTYDLPIDYCMVITWRYSTTRGLAIAIPWVGRNTTEYECWINPLFETWKGWKKIGANNLFTYTNQNYTPATSLTDTTSWARVMRCGYQRIFSCAVLPLAAGTQKQIITLADTDKPISDVQFVSPIYNTAIAPGQFTLKTSGAVILDAPSANIFKANIAYMSATLA